MVFMVFMLTILPFARIREEGFKIKNKGKHKKRARGSFFMVKNLFYLGINFILSENLTLFLEANINGCRICTEVFVIGNPTFSQ